MPDVSLGEFYCGSGFFVGVEDVVWVEDVFDLFEDVEHFGAVHLFDEGASD